MLLFASKLFVAWWITLMSAIGVWLPVYYVRRHREESLVGSGSFGRGKRAASVTASATTRWYLSLANCVSAGMLLTMALLHFFPESFEVDTSGTAPPPTSLCFWMLVGLLIPAVLERFMKGGGSHSHGVASESDGDHTHGEAGGNGSGGSSGGGAVSTATLLIVLMCFHGMTEGLLLGFEDKVAALLSAALPLSIHKFCDGLVIGVAMAKETFTHGSDDTTSAATAAQAEGGRAPARFWRRLYQGPVGVWLLLTPITMICVVLFAVTTKSHTATADGTANNGSFPSALPAGRVLASTEAGGGVTTSAVSTLAAVQAMGSGSFIYIGLGILSGEELKGVCANAALLAGVALTGTLFFFSSEAH